MKPWESELNEGQLKDIEKEIPTPMLKIANSIIDRKLKKGLEEPKKINQYLTLEIKILIYSLILFLLMKTIEIFKGLI